MRASKIVIKDLVRINAIDEGFSCQPFLLDDAIKLYKTFLLGLHTDEEFRAQFMPCNFLINLIVTVVIQ